MQSQSRDLARRQVLSELQSVDEETRSELMFLAAVTAAACVARADGWVDRAERDRLVSWMEESQLCDSLSLREAAETFDLRLRQMEEEDGADLAMAALRRVAGLRQARMVVACAEQVARADGQVHASEEQIVALVRRAVGLRAILSLPAQRAPGIVADPQM